MPFYYILGAVGAALVIFGGIGSVIVYLVRKDLKVRDMANKIPTMEKNTHDIQVLDARVTRLEKDVNAAHDKIDKGFSQTNYFQSLLLDGLVMTMEANPELNNSERFERYRKRLSDNTMTVAARDHTHLHAHR